MLRQTHGEYTKLNATSRVKELNEPANIRDIVRRENSLRRVRSPHPARERWLSELGKAFASKFGPFNKQPAIPIKPGNGLHPRFELSGIKGFSNKIIGPNPNTR